MTKNFYAMGYHELALHEGHKLNLSEAIAWSSNRPYSIEIRCENPECEGCEPLFEMDFPIEDMDRKQLVFAIEEHGGETDDLETATDDELRDLVLSFHED